MWKNAQALTIIKYMKNLLFLALLPSICFSKIYYFNQWHLLPGVNTRTVIDIKAYPQYKNQYEIYKKISDLITEKKVKTIIVEGCEGEITSNFGPTYNGWTMNELNLYLSDNKKDVESYNKKILTHLGMKLKTYFKSEINVYCGDNLKLMKEHQIAFSDLRGYLGYYSRLVKYKDKDKKRFDAYVNSMLDGKKINVDDPIEYAKENARISLEQVKTLLVKRNDGFLKMLQKYPNSALILGAAHYDDLSNKLQNKKLKFDTIVQVTEGNSPDKLIKQIETLLK